MPDPAPSADVVDPPVAVEEPARDPFVKDLLASIGKVLDPTPAPEVESQITNTNLSDIVTRKQDERKKAVDAPPADPPPVAAPALAAPAPPATAPTPELVRPTIVLKRKDETPPAPAVVPATPPTPAPSDDQLKAKREEEAYVKGLTPEQQEEISLARYADANVKPGILAKTIEFFRSVDKFIDEHPEHEASELDQFITKSKPQWGDAERRRIERKMISEEATRQATETVRKELEPEKQRLRQMEAKPLIEKAITETETTLTTASAVNKDAIAMPVAVVQKMKGMTYGEAKEAYPVEAPIYFSAINAARVWMAVANGAEPYNPQDPTHAWLSQFVADQGAAMLQQPQSSQVMNGRQFLPLGDYLALRASKPDELNKYWTFNNDMVVDLIAGNALINHTNEVKRLEKAGWKREKVSTETENQPPVTNPPKPIAETSVTRGPAARAGSIPGAADTEIATHPNDSFLETIVPGSTKILRR